jgi:Protein of unknown function (DUF2442)
MDLREGAPQRRRAITVTTPDELRSYTGDPREVDLSDDLWGPMAEPLQDPAYFRQVSVDPELGTVVWPNGYDLDPDVLHGDYEDA